MHIVIRTRTVPGLVKKRFTFKIFGKYAYKNGCSDEQCGPVASCTSFQNKY